MGGTKEGGQLAKQKNLAKDPDFYHKIGALGGKMPCVGNGGFRNADLAKRAGKLGGAKSRRGKSSDPVLPKGIESEQLDV